MEIETQLDDLTALIDQEPQPINPVKEPKMPEIDNLSLLLEPIPAPADLDDLSTLIDRVSTQVSPKTDLCQDLSVLDDLSLLIDGSASLETPELDDLSLLITPDAKIHKSLPPTDDPMDDLSALIGDTPSLRPDITPEENLKEYKAAVMKIIIGLKTQDLSAEETTKRLNRDGVQTISGKSQWSEKAISQIYKFIDSAK